MDAQTDNQQRKVSEIAWLAGFWDGEGSVGIRVQKYHPQGRHTYFAPYAQLTNSNNVALEKADRILTELGIGHYIRWAKPRSFPDGRNTRHYKALWYIKIDGLKRCKAFLNTFYSYLVAKQQDAALVGEFIASREASHYKHLPYTEHELSIVNQFRVGRRKGKPTEGISLTSLNDYMLGASSKDVKV